MRVGLVGCGLIGQKRAKALGEGGKLVACADKEVGAVEVGTWLKQNSNQVKSLIIYYLITEE